MRVAPFVIEQPLLAPQTTAVPTERAIGANHALARDDDANHVRSIRATNCATRIFIAQALCHPRIRTRFANRDRLQNFPRAQLEGGSHRSERNFKLQLLARKVTAQLGTDYFKIPMFPGHDICAQLFSQNRQLAFCCAPVDEFEQPQALVVGDRAHRSEWRIDSLRKEWCVRLGVCWRFAKDLRERVAKTALRFKATPVSRLIHAIALSNLAQSKTHSARAMIRLKCHSIMTLKLASRG